MLKNIQLQGAIILCDDENNERLDKTLAVFVRDSCSLAELAGNPDIDFLVMAGIPPFKNRLDKLIVRWERILGAAENMGLPEAELKSRRSDIARGLGKNLASWAELWFPCEYKIA